MARRLSHYLATAVLVFTTSTGAALTSVGSANADTIVLSSPGAVPTTSAELVDAGFLIPEFKAVPEHPAQSQYFYGHDQGAAQPSQPSYITAQWHDLPPISPNAPDGSAILSNVSMIAPQLSIDQFEGLTIPGQDYLIGDNPQLPNPFPYVEPDVTYPLMWQFKGQGSLAQCGTMAANVVSQAFNDYSGSNPWRLAAQDVPTLYYAGAGDSADPGQPISFTATQNFTATQQVSATVKSPNEISGQGAGAGGSIPLPTISGTGTAGISEEESTATTYSYTNQSSTDEDYVWLSTQADYYTTVGMPYVFYKPATGGVLAEYPDGLGPWFNSGPLPSGWNGNLGSWQGAESDPGAANASDTSLSFPWLSAGTCYVGESLTLARILHPNEAGLHLIAQAPFAAGSSRR
ncbi:MAG TPA: hypothetical protein VJ914_00540 [Pseudonocardiaceae bacterium]|nr:hypothetical protein [Pseudonocardiaceae bacterium]